MAYRTVFIDLLIDESEKLRETGLDTHLQTLVSIWGIIHNIDILLKEESPW